MESRVIDATLLRCRTKPRLTDDDPCATADRGRPPTEPARPRPGPRRPCGWPRMTGDASGAAGLPDRSDPDALDVTAESPLTVDEAAYVDAARAPNTLRGYRSDWAD